MLLCHEDQSNCASVFHHGSSPRVICFIAANTMSGQATGPYARYAAPPAANEGYAQGGGNAYGGGAPGYGATPGYGGGQSYGGGAPGGYGQQQYVDPNFQVRSLP